MLKYTPALLTYNCWRNGHAHSYDAHCPFEHSFDFVATLYICYLIFVNTHLLAVLGQTVVLCLFCSAWILIYIRNMSRVPDQNGVSQAWYIVEIRHSGREPSIYTSQKMHVKLTGENLDIWHFSEIFEMMGSVFCLIWAEAKLDQAHLWFSSPPPPPPLPPLLLSVMLILFAFGGNGISEFFQWYFNSFIERITSWILFLSCSMLWIVWRKMWSSKGMWKDLGQISNLLPAVFYPKTNLSDLNRNWNVQNRFILQWRF